MNGLTSSELTNQIVSMAQENIPVRVISDEVGLSPGRVRARLRDASIPSPGHVPDDYRQKIQDMKPAEAVEFLLDALDVLTGCAPNEVHPVDEAIGHLPHLARRVAVALYEANGRYLSADAIYAAMYFDRPADDTPDAKIVSVYVCKLRKRMPDGWSIKTHWGFGFSLQRPGVSS